MSKKTILNFLQNSWSQIVYSDFVWVKTRNESTVYIKMSVITAEVILIDKKNYLINIK